MMTLLARADPAQHEDGGQLVSPFKLAHLMFIARIEARGIWIAYGDVFEIALIECPPGKVAGPDPFRSHQVDPFIAGTL